MKVNMLSTPMDGRCGVGNYTKYLVEKERELGIEVRHISIDERKKTPFYWLNIAYNASKNSDIVHIQYEYHFFGRLLSLIGICTPLFYIFLHLLSNIYHFKIITTMHEVFEPIKKISRLFKAKNFFSNILRNLYSIYSIIRNKSIISTSDVLIVHSNVNRNILIKQGVPEKKIYLIPYGAKNPIFLNKKVAKKKLGIDANKKVIGILGYVNFNKGHDLLLKATKHLDKERVVLIAGGMRFNEHREYFENLKKIERKNIIIYGFVKENDFPTILSAIDIMVLPYRKVSTSGILNWSLAYQIPTITSDLPYFKNINEKYRCLLLFKSEDIISLSNAIKNLLNNVDLQKRLKVAAKKYYEENNYTESVKQTISLYLKMK